MMKLAKISIPLLQYMLPRFTFVTFNLNDLLIVVVRCEIKFKNVSMLLEWAVKV